MQCIRQYRTEDLSEKLTQLYKFEFVQVVQHNGSIWKIRVRWVDCGQSSGKVIRMSATGTY